MIHTNHLDIYSDMFIKFLTCFDVKVTFGYLWIPLVVSCCFIGFLFPQKIPLIFQARHPLAPRHPATAFQVRQARAKAQDLGEVAQAIAPRHLGPLVAAHVLPLAEPSCRAGCRAGMGNERNKMDGFRSPKIGMSWGFIQVT